MPRIPRHADPCPYTAATAALKALGGRWKVLVVRRLLEAGPQRYGELRRALPEGLTEKMLSQVLRELAADGLLAREERVARAPKVVVYRLTGVGRAAREVVEALASFGRRLEPRGDRDPPRHDAPPPPGG